MAPPDTREGRNAQESHAPEGPATGGCPATPPAGHAAETGGVTEQIDGAVPETDRPRSSTRAEEGDAAEEPEGPGGAGGREPGRGPAGEAPGLVTELPLDPDDDLASVEDGDVSERLVSIVESLLFAASEPLSVRRIRQILKEPTTRQIQRAIKRLRTDYGGRGIVLRQVARGFCFGTHPDNAGYVQRLLAGRPARLTRSQLETLAVVAYRQPVTKAQIDFVRGVDCGAVLRGLLERDLLKVVGRKEVPGRPQLYGTTVRFLEFFNLKSLRDLPPLREVEELSEEELAQIDDHLEPPPGGEETEQEAMGQTRLELGEERPSTSEPEQGGRIIPPAGAGEGAADGEDAPAAPAETLRETRAVGHGWKEEEGVDADAWRGSGGAGAASEGPVVGSGDLEPVRKDPEGAGEDP